MTLLNYLSLFFFAFFYLVNKSEEACPIKTCSVNNNFNTNYFFDSTLANFTIFYKFVSSRATIDYLECCSKCNNDAVCIGFQFEVSSKNCSFINFLGSNYRVTRSQYYLKPQNGIVSGYLNYDMY